MSENEQQPKKNDVTRRQFLNYSLMGVGAFMAAGMITPMLRFAIDPLLKAEAATDMVAIDNIEKYGTEPIREDFQLTVTDGWAEYDMQLSAWIQIIENENGEQEVLALSPICKHLGCTVQWDTYDEAPDHFFCPCHNGLYDKVGINIPGTPPTAPLDVYRYEIDEDGTLYLGQAVPREEL
jgi:menaquinol-cytochrome c reductase iron-sulfur subunit